MGAHLGLLCTKNGEKKNIFFSCGGKTFASGKIAGRGRAFAREA